MARQPFNTRWAQGVETQDDLNTFKVPSEIRISTGWEGGQDKDAPPAGHENYWHNRVDSALQDLERKGAMSWHPLAIYGAGAACYALDGFYYESLASNNTNNNPPESPNYWRQIGQSLYSSYSVGEYKDVSHNGSPDNGWLKSNGSVLLRIAYSKLFDKIGTIYNTGGELSTQFRIPDWRGAFPRFLDDGRGIDPSRSLNNSLQESQNLSHSHSTTVSSSGVHSHATNGSPGIGGGSGPVNSVQQAAGQQQSSTAGDHTHTVTVGPNGGAESRPVNLVQVRWIRYL